MSEGIRVSFLHIAINDEIIITVYKGENYTKNAMPLNLGSGVDVDDLINTLQDSKKTLIAEEL